MNKEILFILLPDYAAHEAVYFSQAITADDFAMKKNPKYVNKVVAPTLEPISSIGGFRTLPDYSFDTMPDDYVALVLIGGFGWNTPVAEKVMPIIKSAIEQEKVIGAICNAASFMAKCGIDRETTSKTLQKSSVIQKISMARYRLANPNNPKDGIMLDHQIRLTNFTFGSFTLVGATMTYDGHLVVAAQNGLLVLNRALTTIEDSYPLPSDQILTNSICIDENGGVYVASNSRTPGGKGLMQKLICKDGKISTSQADGAWQAYYDGGPQAPCIKLGHGTGSTPTLMGFGQDKDKLVVITDGSKRMKLVAFWRDEIPSDAQQVAGYDKRIAGVHEVTCGLGTSTEWIQSEQSVVVGGYDAFVVNNINVTNQEINDKIIGVIAIGPIVKGPQGAECVRWNTKEKKWESKWTRSDVSSVSMIPAVSIKSEMVFVCGWNDASGWEVTGLDWKSGATRHRSILGKNNRANGAYAIIQYLANGDLLFNSVAGPIRVKY